MYNMLFYLEDPKETKVVAKLQRKRKNIITQVESCQKKKKKKKGYPQTTQRPMITIP